jgi:hypothetical protein
MMLRKTLLALATVATVGLLAPNIAQARGGGGHGGFGGGGFHGGGFHGGGFHGGGFRGRGFGFGLGGFGLGYGLGYGLYGPYGYDGYDYPYYGYGYPDDGGCYVERRRIHTKKGWRIKRVEVCE